MENQEKISHDSLSVFEFLWKWKNQIGILCLIAAIAAGVFSSAWFVKPKYKSTVIFYPSTSNSVSTALLTDEVKIDPLEFGAEEHAEQLIQILESDAIRDYIIKKYNLMAHYEIDTNSPYKNAILQKEFESNIHFKRTEYMSVVIEVLDTKPELAALIANDIATQLDSTKNKIQLEKAKKAFTIVETEYHKKQQEVQSLNDSLNFFRRLGVFDYQLQTEYLTKELIQATAVQNNETARIRVFDESGMNKRDTAYINAKARLAGALKITSALTEQQQILAKFGGAFNSVRAQLDVEIVEMNRLQKRYQNANVDATEVLPVKFVVNSAKPAEKKTYPIRWLIVLLSVAGTFLVSVVSLIAFENYTAMKKKAV